MKRFLSIVLCVSILMLSSCSSSKTQDETTAETSIETQMTEGSVITSEETEETTETDITEAPVEERVILGDERTDLYMPLLEGKKVALFTNQSGIVGNQKDGEHILDKLVGQNVDVVAVFCPEHGFRGTQDAGADIANSVDKKTGVPLLSIYSSEDTHMPSAEEMGLFDVLVVDMQDVGLRYYTYYISLYYLMDACASYDKEMIILDRPNPNGFYVDGPILQDGYKSNVGMLPIPVVYGMTWCELAQLINGEGWLKSGKDSCKLTVIPCENYTHQTITSELATNPSPNIRSMRAVYLYASLCFFENTKVSVGRGTDSPFEIYGSPYLPSDGYIYTFTPQSMEGATNPPFEGQLCYGMDLSQIPEDQIRNEGIDLDYLIDAYNDITGANPDISFWGTPDGQGRYWIDLLSGSSELRTMIESGMSEEEIKATWQDDIDVFMEQRAPYLIYD